MIKIQLQQETEAQKNSFFHRWTLSLSFFISLKMLPIVTCLSGDFNYPTAVQLLTIITLISLSLSLSLSPRFNC